ncbi:hypothetical protein B5M45_19365 [Mycobacterium simiae]|uniref:Uncharacterized protein n=2 Tax=Mycobacterium simiae TaxID=1784 RepID=A0A1X0XY27_MYCSI|nr:hypothetical protein B5M45_19365 [Mycobacterium simiae]
MVSDPGEMVEWLAEKAPDTLERRVTVVPVKGNLGMYDEGVQAFASNGNVHSGLGRPGIPGGPVLAYFPDIKLLADAVAMADGQPLGVIEFFAGDVAGWAAATNAINLDTGEPTPGVPADIHAALVELRDAGYDGFHKDRESYFARRYFPPIDKLLAAGYPYKFVAGYLVALGIQGKNADEYLKRIYVPPSKRRRPGRF